MHFDIKLATAEFIFLMNTVLVFDSSSYSCQGTEPICNNVTYILVLWLLNPCIRYFLNAHISPMCDPVPQCHFGDDGKQHRFCRNGLWLLSIPKSLKFSYEVCMQPYNSMKHWCFYFCLEQDRLLPYVKADITSSFIFMHSKKVNIHKNQTLISWTYCQAPWSHGTCQGTILLVKICIWLMQRIDEHLFYIIL